MPKIAILWESCGPYHFSRLERFREIAGRNCVVALELSSKNSTYAWRVESRAENQILSLFPECAAEDVSLWPLFTRLRRVFREQQVEVFFAPSYWPAYSLVAALAAKSLGIRIVFMGDSHYASGSNQGLAIVIKRLLVKLYDSALVAGSLHRSFLRHLGMPVEKIFDGYDTVDNAHFEKYAEEARQAPGHFRTALGLPEKYILSLGRFVAKKNLETAINAYGSLVARNAHCGHDLVFVGSGPMQSRLVELALLRGLRVVEHPAANGPLPETSYNGPERRKTGGSFPGGQRFTDPKLGEQWAARGTVHFYPFAQIETVPVYYALATAFVLASTSDEWGLVVNEAMACSCPVVVSRSVGSSLDLVVPEVTGHRFVAENAHELAWCLEKLCRDTAYAQRLGRQAHTHIGAWSNSRFAHNALRAAEAALGVDRSSLPGDMPAGGPEGAERSGLQPRGASSTPWEQDPRVWFLQTCFPDYRMPVFQCLHERLGTNFHLFSGTTYFTPDIKTTTDFFDWHSLVENRFWAGRRFLWQMGACEAMFQADVVVMELNPRILSNWVILAARALWRAPTLLWGHAWGRDDVYSVRNVMRLYMMRLASGVIAYTRTQRDEVRRVFPSFKVFAATNSLIRAEECSPLPAAVHELDTVLYVGRINRPKKVGLLVEAFLAARLPEQAKLKIVGSGSEREQIEGYLSQHPEAAGRVQFLGHVQSHEILKSLYSTAFCAVSPGYVGLGAIQTFSFGVPLVLADKEPHAPEVEACHEGENTVFFEADNAKSLALRLEHMWTDRAAWLAKRQALAKWTADNYSVEAMIAGFVEAVDAVKDRNQSPREPLATSH